MYVNEYMIDMVLYPHREVEMCTAGPRVVLFLFSFLEFLILLICMLSQ